MDEWIVIIIILVVVVVIVVVSIYYELCVHVEIQKWKDFSKLIIHVKSVKFYREKEKNYNY